jgi:hypothetical protein
MKKSTVVFLILFYLTGCFVCYNTVKPDINNPAVYSATSWPGAIIAVVIDRKNEIK